MESKPKELQVYLNKRQPFNRVGTFHHFFYANNMEMVAYLNDIGIVETLGHMDCVVRTKI